MLRCVAAASLLVLAAPMATAGKLPPLNKVQVPLPPNIDDFVIDRDAAIQLGKALFWEEQTAGDGRVACATCHFQAGADVRTTNTVNPRANGFFTTIPVNATLTLADFPIENGDVVGSQGVTKSLFNSIVLGDAVDGCTPVFDPLFNDGGLNVRQVTGRNAPSNFNAIFNFRSFWDGRANNEFNGVTPAGPTDPTNPTVLMVGPDNSLTPVAVSIPDASLASQAVGPPNNDVEMSCSGRTFPELARKLLSLTPLGLQSVHPDDSVLGDLSNAPLNGLDASYADLIQEAFNPAFVSDSVAANDFTVTENNFSLFWGLSILLYESTLVSDDTPFDRYAAGQRSALTAQERRGLKVFTGQGRCDQCHKKATLTLATVDEADGNPLKGFFNTGVRPIAEDSGDILQGNGFFKTPGLRNAELNGPYFHNGAYATLRQVVDFYDQGGEFPVKGITDGQIRPLGLSETQKNDLVAFLLALTDDRVRRQKAPFDHPSLNVPNGPAVPAVGRDGGAAAQPFLNANPFQP